MTRLNAVLVAAGLAVGAVGCAHCDTCDDFPAPCVGPNCATGPMGAYGMASGPTAYSGPMTLGATVPAGPAGSSLGGSVIDSAVPAPSVPGTAPATAPAPAPPSTSPFERPAAPAGNAPSPPPSGDPAARTRPGS